MLVLLAVCILANSCLVNAEKPHAALKMKLAARIIEVEKPNEVLEMKQARTYMAFSNYVGNKCDTNWSCPGSQPCCDSRNGWRCCPHIGGNCCSGGWYCCPHGSHCNGDNRCD